MRLDTEKLYEIELTKFLGKKYSKSNGLGDTITIQSVENAINNAIKRLSSDNPLDYYHSLNTTYMHKVAEIILRE